MNNEVQELKKQADEGKFLYKSNQISRKEAKKYIEGRPIDLVDKAELIKRLKKVDTM